MAIESIRPAAVAGLFYPADAHLLQAQVGELLAAAMPMEQAFPPPKALMVPHAGYIYSGAIAANAYALLKPLRSVIERVVLLGPAHRVPVRCFALPAAQSFATPLGVVPVSREDWLMLQSRGDVVVDDRPHAFEHCLEVQLPFLQSMLDRFELVPVLVGDAPAHAVAELLASLWGGPETLIVISSDLSHYQPYEQARACDRATVDQIVRLSGSLGDEQACGARPLNGFLKLAEQLGLEAHLLDLRNSGDTAGDRSRVVGYASIAFSEGHRHAGALRH